MQAILSSAYFGPVQWYQKLNRYDRCIIESHDNYVKQTFRNRCVIAAANGPQTLTVPIESYASAKCPMRDVRISDHGSWRHLHWNALVSAYGESPFFDYYADDLRPFFERRYEFLFDFNMEIMSRMCSLLDIRPSVSVSEEYLTDCIDPLSAMAEKNGGNASEPDRPVDFREVIRPKRPPEDPSFVARPYYQVYADRHGFLPNLSILDLLFNEGPEGIFWL